MPLPFIMPYDTVLSCINIVLNAVPAIAAFLKLWELYHHRRRRRGQVSNGHLLTPVPGRIAH